MARLIPIVIIRKCGTNLIYKIYLQKVTNIIKNQYEVHIYIHYNYIPDQFKSHHI